ncbi:MAG: carbohydrate porin, partial [Planctomycetota bacterium]
HAWYSGVDRPVFGEPGENDPAFGVGLGIDQEVRDDIGLWLRYGLADPSVSQIAHALSFGASIDTAVAAAQGEVLGLGYALTLPSDDYTDAVGDRDPEHHVEVYWRWDLGNGLAVTPDLQYVLDPAGDPDADGVAAFILRGEVSF